jgi:cytidyltransferase-like protein
MITDAKKLLKKRPENIVFVSGVFDILHEGHFVFLKEAKQIVGDSGVLLVAVHDDDSVREKKGPERPFNTLDIRLGNLDRIVDVDFVMPWYGWNNIIEFVKKLKPEYLAVTDGDPYIEKKQEIMDELGGRLVVVTERLEDFSTTKIINEMNKHGNIQ